MGFETYWVDDVVEANQVITPESIVIACNVGYQNLQYVDGARYILHNSDDREDLKRGEYVNLKVYTHEVLEKSVEDLGELSYWCQDERTLFQPWATDLMPPEIHQLETIIRPQSQTINWVGSVLWGDQGNVDQLQEYSNLCSRNSFDFKVIRYASLKETIDLIRESRHAPAIQGDWQVRKGYVPCRVFKNLSYGCWTVTNSQTVSDLLEIKSNATISEAFESAESFLRDGNEKMIREKMLLVAEKHTYVNRLSKLLAVLGIK